MNLELKLKTFGGTSSFKWKELDIEGRELRDFTALTNSGWV